MLCHTARGGANNTLVADPHACMRSRVARTCLHTVVVTTRGWDRAGTGAVPWCGCHSHVMCGIHVLWCRGIVRAIGHGACDVGHCLLRGVGGMWRAPTGGGVGLVVGCVGHKAARATARGRMATGVGTQRGRILCAPPPRCHTIARGRMRCSTPDGEHAHMPNCRVVVVVVVVGVPPSCSPQRGLMWQCEQPRYGVGYTTCSGCPTLGDCGHSGVCRAAPWVWHGQCTIVRCRVAPHSVWGALMCVWCRWQRRLR